MHPNVLGLFGMQFLLTRAVFEQTAHHHKKDRYKHHRQRGAGQNAADHAGANGTLAG